LVGSFNRHLQIEDLLGSFEGERLGQSD